MDRKAGIRLALGMLLGLAGPAAGGILDRAGAGPAAYLILGLAGICLLCRLQPPPDRKDAVLFLKGICLAVVCMAAAAGISVLFGARLERGEGLSWVWFPAVCLGAVWEESVFRAVIIPPLCSLGSACALLLSTALFTLAHWGNAAVSHALAGAVLGLCFLLTGRVWTGLGFHMTWNMLSLVLGHILVLAGPAGPAEWIVLLCAAGILLMRLMGKERENHDGDQSSGHMGTEHGQ